MKPCPTSYLIGVAIPIEQRSPPREIVGIIFFFREFYFDLTNHGEPRENRGNGYFERLHVLVVVSTKAYITLQSLCEAWSSLNRCQRRNLFLKIREGGNFTESFTANKLATWPAGQPPSSGTHRGCLERWGEHERAWFV
jgi:hypothetical protein